MAGTATSSDGDLYMLIDSGSEGSAGGSVGESGEAGAGDEGRGRGRRRRRARGQSHRVHNADAQDGDGAGEGAREGVHRAIPVQPLDKVHRVVYEFMKRGTGTGGGIAVDLGGRASLPVRPTWVPVSTAGHHVRTRTLSGVYVGGCGAGGW
jgi:hypothetical protein